MSETHRATAVDTQLLDALSKCVPIIRAVDEKLSFDVAADGSVSVMPHGFESECAECVKNPRLSLAVERHGRGGWCEPETNLDHQSCVSLSRDGITAEVAEHGEWKHYGVWVIAEYSAMIHGGKGDAWSDWFGSAEEAVAAVEVRAASLYCPTTDTTYSDPLGLYTGDPCPLCSQWHNVTEGA